MLFSDGIRGVAALVLLGGNEHVARVEPRPATRAESRASRIGPSTSGRFGAGAEPSGARRSAVSQAERRLRRLRIESTTGVQALQRR
jgi:hypothetical protein